MILVIHIWISVWITTIQATEKYSAANELDGQVLLHGGNDDNNIRVKLEALIVIVDGTCIKGAVKSSLVS